MLDYPTVTRNEAGEWNYFDATLQQPDGYDQGQDLAFETLRIASRQREADFCALLNITTAAVEALNDGGKSPLAHGFMDVVLNSAVYGRDRESVAVQNFRDEWRKYRSERVA
jgi:hypothetical protein